MSNPVAVTVTIPPGAFRRLPFNVQVYLDAVKRHRSTGIMDKAQNPIHEGDFLKTNEAGWVGFVIESPEGDGSWILLDFKGGFSAEPEWSQCILI